MFSLKDVTSPHYLASIIPFLRFWSVCWYLNILRVDILPHVVAAASRILEIEHYPSNTKANLKAKSREPGI